MPRLRFPGRVIVMAFAAVLVLATEFQVNPAQSATPSDTLVVARDISDLRTPDPSRSYDISGGFLQFFPYSRLVQQRAPDVSRIQPDLATSWSVNADASIYTFKLRDATFTTGNPVTAEDVRFSLLRVKNIKGYGAFLADPIKDVQVVDPKTVRIVLTGPNAAFLSALAANMFGILDSKTVRARGGVETPGADTLDKAEQWFATHSAGSGPYVLKRFVRESEIVLERNDTYYGQKPFFRQVIIKHVKEPSTQALLLQRGDADVALDLSLDQVEPMRGKPGVDIHEALTLITVYLGLNTSVKPWDNPQVREAVKYAIDYDGLLKLMRGAGLVVSTPVAVGVLGMTESLNAKLMYRQDLNKARELLSKAGVRSARVKLMYEAGANYGTANMDRFAQKLRADLARVGITLDLQPLASAIFLTTYRQGTAETVIGWWFPDFIDPDNWSYFVSGFINKRLRWTDEASGKLVADAVKVGSLEKRSQLYREYYQRLRTPASPYVGLVQPKVRIAARSSVANFRYHPLYFFEIDRATRK